MCVFSRLDPVRDVALDSREYRGSGSDLRFCRAHGVKPSGLEECRSTAFRLYMLGFPNCGAF